MQRSGYHLAEEYIAAMGKTKAGNRHVGSLNTFSNDKWTSLRKAILERLNYFGREEKARYKNTKKKKNQKQLHHIYSL